jgi:hypothetical protein
MESERSLRLSKYAVHGSPFEMMNSTDIDLVALEKQNQEFFQKAERAFKGLFGAARAKNELDCAFALHPEERGFQDSGWSSAAETFLAFHDYLEFLDSSPDSRFKLRVALSFYCHLSEASGFYEVPKKLMLVYEGDPYFRSAFHSIVERNRRTGNAMVPNASRVFRDLVGHAKNLGFDELAEVFKESFDPELRNAYAHANYILRPNEIRIKDKATNRIRIISIAEFNLLFNKGLQFFHALRNVLKEYMMSYVPAKIIMGRLHDEPISPCKIEFHPEHKAFVISRADDYWRWVIDAREIFADEEASSSPLSSKETN